MPPSSSSANSSETDHSTVEVDLRRALLGGALAAVVALIGVWVVGRLSGAEAQVLTETALPRLLDLCNTVILASATILALMLTLLGLSSGSSVELKPVFYRRIQQLSLLDAIVFVAAMLVFLLFNIPIVEADKVPVSWYNVIYYTSVSVAALLGGALVSIVTMLYSTVRDVISVVGLGNEDHAVAVSPSADEER